MNFFLHHFVFRLILTGGLAREKADAINKFDLKIITKYCSKLIKLNK